MMSSENIIEVTEENFQYEVLAYSNTTPVVVDFWADWCQPCKMLSPVLEKLAREAQGAFRLAKVDADRNRNLVMQYKIQSLPTVLAIRSGQLIDEFKGAKTESEVRQFLRSLAPASQPNLALERGSNMLLLGRWKDAVQSFKEVLKASPDDSLALLGLAKSLLAQGNPKDALAILNSFPTSKEYAASERLLPLAKAMAEFQMTPDFDLEDDKLIAFRQAVRLVEIGNLPAAADGLLALIRKDKNYRGGQAREVILAVLEILGDTEESRRLRNELASALF